MPVKAIPEGYHSVTSYLIIDGAGGARLLQEEPSAPLN